ncbi:MAG: non-heme iron oxygenase ferredoxin subunit [Deltaproteobacteria bacterium]
MGNPVEVAKVGEIKPGSAKLVEVNGKEIAVFNCDGEYYAIGNECTHIGGPLCDGDIEGETVSCPWHGAEFNIKTGEVLGPPAEENIASYKVSVEGEAIKIEI